MGPGTWHCPLRLIHSICLHEQNARGAPAENGFGLEQLLHGPVRLDILDVLSVRMDEAESLVNILS